MLTALVSLLTHRTIRPRLAMTGEFTLSGQVLPIGGVKEKVLAAHRAGVRTLILPAENEKDYIEEIPLNIREEMTAHFVKDARQVLRLAFPPASATKPAKSAARADELSGNGKNDRARTRSDNQPAKRKRKTPAARLNKKPIATPKAGGTRRVLGPS